MVAPKEKRNNSKTGQQWPKSDDYFLDDNRNANYKYKHKIIQLIFLRRNQQVLMTINSSFKISVGHKAVQITVFWPEKKTTMV